MAGTTTASVPTANVRESDVNAVIVEHNKLVDDAARLQAAAIGTGNITVATPAIGTTVTVAIATTNIQIAGIPVLVAALTAQGLGALGTIPNAKWGIITMERVAAGTCTFVSGAANYSTGYDSEALALAAIPAITAAKVRVGYFTVQAAAVAAGWIAATDALAGGTGGTNPAQTTNYYPGVSLFDTTLYTAAKIGNRAGTART